jgi:hypothetical protein
MIRRHALLRAGGFSEAPAYRAEEDYDLWLRLIASPGFSWCVTDGAPLLAYRELGTDSISNWTDHLEPDYARRRWAHLECMGRVTARVAHAGGLHGQDLDDMLVTLRTVTEECAHRSRVCGWRRVSWLAYQTAVLYAALLRNGRDATLIMSRALRFPFFGRATAASAMPATVPRLARRAFHNAVALLARRPAPAYPVEMKMTGRDNRPPPHPVTNPPRSRPPAA